MTTSKLIRFEHIATFALEDAPGLDYTDKKSQKPKVMNPQRVTVSFDPVSGVLISVSVVGPIKRDDGTEITWQRATYVFMALNAAAMPQWLTDLLAENGWAF